VVAGVAAGLAMLSAAAFYRQSYRLRRAALLGYAGFYGGVAGSVALAMPLSPGIGPYGTYALLAVWGYLRLRYRSRS
jgi:NhaP-type Na+/H+ or K+/H+ antiporter